MPSLEQLIGYPKVQLVERSYPPNEDVSHGPQSAIKDPVPLCATAGGQRTTTP